MILGLDPGLNACGFSVIDKQNNNFVLIDYGILCKHKNNASEEAKLYAIYSRLDEILNKYAITQISFEKVFHNKKKAFGGFSVQQVIGIIKCLSAKHKAILDDFTPSQIKKALTGYGKAEKIEVTQAVYYWLNKNYLTLSVVHNRKNVVMDLTPEALILYKKDHVGDAIAAALTKFLYETTDAYIINKRKEFMNVSKKAKG